MPLGIGMLRIMVFGTVCEEHIHLNNDTYWSGFEFDGFDNPEIYDHLGKMRHILFDGKYTQAQQF